MVFKTLLNIDYCYCCCTVSYQQIVQSKSLSHRERGVIWWVLFNVNPSDKMVSTFFAWLKNFY